MSKKLIDFFAGYYQYLQILTLALFFYVLAIVIFRYAYPEQIANWFLPDLYLPLQLPLWAGNFFFFTFLTQNRRLGLWLSLIIFLWLFFRLQHFIFTLPLFLAWLTSASGLFFWLMGKEVINWYREKKKL